MVAMPNIIRDTQKGGDQGLNIGDRIFTTSFGEQREYYSEQLASHHAVHHYWKQRLCRVQNSLPSVKNRALGKDFLCRVPHSAKNCTRQRVLCRVPGTRQKSALGKGLLCRVPDSQQKHGTRHRVPHVTVFGHVLLCRVPT